MIPVCEVFKERFGQQILLNLAMITRLAPQGMTMGIIHRRWVKGLPETRLTHIPACQERSWIFPMIRQGHGQFRPLCPFFISVKA
jgi:hypothetical protein